METPVAPIGWPFAFRPPERFIGSLPSFWVQPSLMARAPWPFGINPIASKSMILRFDMGRKSCACAIALKETAFRIVLAVSASVMTDLAENPSEAANGISVFWQIGGLQ